MTSPALLIALKLTSTVGLGLASSFAISLGAFTLPTIYRLADAPSRAAELVRGRVHKLMRLSSSVVAAAGVLQGAAYYLSPAHGRHPYLLYSAIGSLAITGYAHAILEPFFNRVESSGDSEKISNVNGERFSRDFETLMSRTSICGAATATCFIITAIGNFGDLY
ncbi:hypothetical protein PYCC9005_001458 [Savitreella phatthalungensis]